MRSTALFPLLGTALFALPGWSQTAAWATQEDSTPEKYEERVSLGLYAEWPLIVDEHFTYREVIDQEDLHPSGTPHKNTLFAATPQIGLAGHLPFLWNNVLNATGHVTYQMIEYEFESLSSPAVTRKLTTHSIVVQAGGEAGIPLYANPVTDKMFKVFGYLHIIVGKDFIVQNSPKNWEYKNPYWGWAWGGGARYAFDMFSISAGVKNAYWLWKPSYDPSKGSEKENFLRVRFDEWLTPFITFEFALY